MQPLVIVMIRLKIVLLLLLAFPGTSAIADHPTSLDHLLRQVEEAHKQDARIRKEREQRFLRRMKIKKPCWKNYGIRLPHNATGSNNSDSNTLTMKNRCRYFRQN